MPQRIKEYSAHQTLRMYVTAACLSYSRLVILLTAEQPRCQAFSLIWITFLDPRRGFFQCDNSVIECMYVRVSVEKLSRRLVSHDQSFQSQLCKAQNGNQEDSQLLRLTPQYIEVHYIQVVIPSMCV